MSEAEIRRNLWDRAANTWRRLIDTATVTWDTSTPGEARANASFTIAPGSIGTTELADGAATNAKLADMAAWTLKMRNAGTTGDAQDQTINDLTEETSLANGDFVPFWDIGGSVMRKLSLLNLRGFSGWQLIEQRAIDNVEVFTGLTGWSELRVYLHDITTSSSATVQVQVSIDNGANFLTTSGDYKSVQQTGIVTNGTAISMHATATTAARRCEITIRNVDLTVPKTVHKTTGDGDAGAGAQSSLIVIDTANAINALRVNSSAGTPNGGTVYLFGR